MGRKIGRTTTSTLHIPHYCTTRTDRAHISFHAYVNTACAADDSAYDNTPASYRAATNVCSRQPLLYIDPHDDVNFFNLCCVRLYDALENAEEVQPKSGRPPDGGKGGNSPLVNVDTQQNDSDDSTTSHRGHRAGGGLLAIPRNRGIHPAGNPATYSVVSPDHISQPVQPSPSCSLQRLAVMYVSVLNVDYMFTHSVTMLHTWWCHLCHELLFSWYVCLHGWPRALG